MGDYGETDEESRERVRLERAAIVARYECPDCHVEEQFFGFLCGKMKSIFPPIESIFPPINSKFQLWFVLFHFRYDLGREEGAQIDEWEDPGFEVYHKKDRYGFIQ